MVYAIAFTAFSSVALLAWSAFSAVFSDERRVNKRLEGLTAYETSQASAAHPQLKPFSQRVMSPVGESVSKTLGGLAPDEYQESVRRRIVTAGNPHGLDVWRFIASKWLLSLGAGMLLLAVAVFLKVGLLLWLAFFIASVALYWAPDAWLNGVTEARRKAIRIALPDVLDMLTISVEAGLGFDQAIAKLAGTTTGPLPQELARMLQEVQAGTERAVALRRMAERCDVGELSTFVTAIVQAEQMGIPIANVLRIQAREMRLMRRQRAEEQGQKTPVKIVFPLILCILPATLIVVVGPAVVGIGSLFGAW